MPIIVDANVAVETFKNRTPEFLPVLNGLFSGKLKLAYGGKLTDEYSMITEVMRAVTTLDQAGKAIKIDDRIVRAETQEVVNMNLCQSNDEHIIALARVSKARLLCSKDQLLHRDFDNKHLISKPRGKIYQNLDHVHLITGQRC